MQILVIDGQGGGVGSRIIAQLKPALGEGWQLIAVGTNALATAAMLRAGADAGATGENAVVWNAPRAQLIIGPIGIILANAMLGEITPEMAVAISGCDAPKVLVPSAKCSVTVVGTESYPLEAYIRQAVELALQRIAGV